MATTKPRRLKSNNARTMIERRGISEIVSTTSSSKIIKQNATSNVSSLIIISTTKSSLLNSRTITLITRYQNQDGIQIPIQIYLIANNRVEKRRNTMVINQIAAIYLQRIKREKTKVAYSSLIVKLIISLIKMIRMRRIRILKY